MDNILRREAEGTVFLRTRQNKRMEVITPRVSESIDNSGLEFEYFVGLRLGTSVRLVCRRRRVQWN